VVAAIVVAHVAGNGWAMLRDRFTVGDTGTTGRDNLAVVLSSAAVVVLAGAAGAVTAHGDGWRSVVPGRPGYVVLGAAVAVLVPLAWGDTRYSQDIIPLARDAWMYSLPWGTGLAAIGWLRGRAAVAVGVTVVVSAVVFVALVLGPHAVAYFSAMVEESPPHPAAD
jgi:hypothetical protein